MESRRVSARSVAAKKDSGYRQRQGYRNRFAGYSSQFSGWASTFFFYNFPEELEAKFLWNSFQMYGKVVDVYIPSKRDKRGKRYGFVRLTGVKNEIQMERRLNEIWIGSYKMRVKIANDRQRKPASPRKSYAQAVKGQGKRADKASEQSHEKETKETPKKEGGKTRVQVNKDVEKTEGTIEYIPTGDELKWLKGSMVAVVRSMALVSEIQKQMDTDGGSILLSPMGGRRVLLTEKVVRFLSDYMKHNEELFVPLKAWGERCFQMIGETIGEVLLVHEDTKKKAILWDGRVLILCSEANKISKQVKLKVGEQVFEIEIIEEEWRSDQEWRSNPDWWLSENDRKNDLETESDYSISWCQNEDPEMAMDVIGDGEDVSNGSEHLMKDMVSNSNLKIATKIEGCIQIVQETDLEEDENVGLSKEIGPQRRFIQECYPESKEEIWAKGVAWVTPRTRQRLARRVETCQVEDDKVHIAAAVSISDGCIENRNRVLWKEMNMHEVRWLMGVGKRLGFKFDNNEEEIQSKLLEAVNREGAERKDAIGRGLGGALKKKEVRRLVQVEKPDFLFLQETKLEKVDVSICRQLWNSDEFDWVVKGSFGASGGEWGANKKQYFLINVYGPNDRQKNASLWEELRKMVTDKEGCWVIAGDFNAVRGPEERRGRIGESPDMKDFDEFIVTMNLVDVKLSNRRYTWYKPDGTARSRLDKFLLSTEMSNMEGEWIQQGLPRNISDHCAIVLKSRTTNWGPRPFRVLDAWQQHLDFKKFVEDKWSWNKEVFGNMEPQYEQAVKKIEQVDMRNEVSDLEDAEIVKRQEGFSEMWDVLRKRELIWKQKSRIEEIEEGLRSCEGSKAPGPDGYNFNFLKYAWHCIKEDFINFFEEFHRNAKVLANRLKSVISKIVSETQSTFVGGRQLVDSVLVLNEVVDEIKKKKQPTFVFKADFEKAYDCVDWSFLDWMMESFGFGTKWRGWIMECLSTARISVLINGSPTKEFEVGKGLRQGDPLSPFLFLMIAEGLQGLVQRAVKEGMMHGIEIGKKGLSVSLLQFADDTIIMGRADAENIHTVKDILKWFELMSGLRINFSESSIFGYNVSEKWLKGSAGMLQCRVGRAPFLYLGLPVDELNKKISWVKWEYVCRAKAKGGLGVPDLHSKNWAMLGKWWYRLSDGVESLWKRVVREKYYGGRREVDITTIECLKVSKIWRDIIRIGGLSLKLRNMLVEGFKWEVGEGNRVGFWSDRWIGVKSLRNLFPRLFALSVKKDGKVSEMGSWEEGRWWWRVEWRRGTIGREKDEEELLEKVLEGVKLKEGAGDVWKWVHGMDGKYEVKLAYDFLATTEGVLEDQMCQLIGCRLVPSKVAFFGWRLCLDRLPTKENLQKCGILLQEGVLSWWGLESVLPNTVGGMAEFFIGSLGSIVGKEMGSCIFLVVAWYLWSVKNHKRLRKQFYKACVPPS
ncbi:hypothetical protein SLEP1_g38153 [Rubroshorea leprosula]|uniref:Reverse transcriptase domain-containing protein n=1 Tax=Rubroshorea leprosula TaxID=152421 RepID=A0AAV5KX62_9ROSI|nr:hypothetical protein SLEP1_g38153 [Rubroshorea leprosula]